MRLSDEEIQQALSNLPNWRSEGNTIERVYQLCSFAEAVAFVNKVAEVAEAANHHPDIYISYTHVKLSLVSHDSGGVTQRDIRMAAKINDLS